MKEMTLLPASMMLTETLQNFPL